MPEELGTPGLVRRPGLGYTTGSRLVALRLPLLGETKGETLQYVLDLGNQESLIQLGRTAYVLRIV